MQRAKIGVVATIGVAAAFALAAAERPSVLAQTRPGLWEISGYPGARSPARLCLADTRLLAQYEHRDQSCTRKVIRDKPAEAVIEYSCPGAGFGRTKITLITPRSLTIETQGISDRLPFNYVLQARRVGDCPAAVAASAH